jgi:DNA-binding CsgD family transcriptional regulator
MVTTSASEPSWIDAHFCDVADPRGLMEGQARLRHLDVLSRQMLQHPMRAFHLDVDRDEIAGPEFAPLRELITRHAGHSALAICATTESEDTRSVLMTMRGSLDRRFTPAELELFHVIGPHVIEAAAVSRGRSVPPDDEALPIAVLGRDGRLLQTTPAFARLWWPTAVPSSAFLPAPVLRALRAGRAWGLPGGRHSLHGHAEPQGGYLLRIRTTSTVDRLTSREREIASLFARGQSYKAIADVLGLAPATVRNHLQKLYVKLEISTRAELIELLLRP